MTVSLGTPYRSFDGEVEASNTPTICRLHRFMPSPTFGHSSIPTGRITTHDGVTVPPLTLTEDLRSQCRGCCKASDAARRRDRLLKARLAGVTHSFHLASPVEVRG